MQKLASSIFDTSLGINDFQSKVQVSIRLPEVVLKKIKELRRSTNISETIELMAIAVLQTPASSISQELPTSGLLYVLGNKYRTEMLDAILHIGNTSNHSWDFSVETCAGRLGIHSEHQFDPVEVVNDDDFDKINLYKAVQENPRKLIWHLTFLKKYLQKLKNKKLFQNLRKLIMKRRQAFCI